MTGGHMTGGLVTGGLVTGGLVTGGLVTGIRAGDRGHHRRATMGSAGHRGPVDLHHPSSSPHRRSAP